MSFPQSNTGLKNCRQFSIAELKLATDDFNQESFIGRRGFGRVYKGTIDNKTTTVAIKRLNLESRQGGSEFWTEIKLLTELQHDHLVSLIGYCNEGQEMILVYEYMERGTLEDHLYGKFAETGNFPFPLELRLNICIGAASGLHFLHTNHPKVIHRDVKSSNILLDANWFPKISDFGLSKIGPESESFTHVSTNVKGTYGYLDPDYFKTGKLTIKSDVYAFGVVLFEVLCGRAAVVKSGEEEERSLANWARKCVKRGKVDQIIDSSLKGQILPACLKTYAVIAAKCLHKEGNKRPGMAEIITVLKSALALQLNKIPSSSSGWSLRRWWTDPFQRAFKFLSLESDSQPQPQPQDPFQEAAKFPSDVRNGAIHLREVVANVESALEQHEAAERKGAIHGFHLEHLPGDSRNASKKGNSSPTYAKAFSFNELKAATRNFHLDRLLGEVRYPLVFKGWIDERTLTAATPGLGKEVAVVKHDRDPYGVTTEANYLAQLHHANLVKLIGFCAHNNRILVYESMPNGSLDTHLLRREQSLSWETRIKVAIGAARGLSFLHNAEQQVIYGDFNSSHILLDVDFSAKLSRFCFARDEARDFLVTRVVYRNPYAPPEYLATGFLSSKSDVYCFGVVLLELLSGRRALGFRWEENLIYWAKPYLVDERKISEIIDTKLEGQYPLKAAFTVGLIALDCLSSSPKQRPEMWKVVARLEQLH